MSRFEAQRQLLGAENEDGSFLIRQSEKDNCGYVLSGNTMEMIKAAGTEVTCGSGLHPRNTV